MNRRSISISLVVLALFAVAMALPAANRVAPYAADDCHGFYLNI